MRFQILAIGKLREPFYRDGAREYLKRLTRYGQVQVKESPKEASPSVRDLAAAYEAVRRAHLKADIRVALDAGGRSFSSEKFASWLQELGSGGASLASFVIGGPHGLAAKALSDSNLVLSLSPMTLPHQMARLLLLEQLYRGFTILRGEPYSK